MAYITWEEDPFPRPPPHASCSWSWSSDQCAGPANIWGQIITQLPSIPSIPAAVYIWPAAPPLVQLLGQTGPSYIQLFTLLTPQSTDILNCPEHFCAPYNKQSSYPAFRHRIVYTPLSTINHSIELLHILPVVQIWQAEFLPCLLASQ